MTESTHLISETFNFCRIGVLYQKKSNHGSQSAMSPEHDYTKANIKSSCLVQNNFLENCFNYFVGQGY